jgi:hypothetical protein
VAEYVRGFTANPADAYPGVNALTLLEVQGDVRARAEHARLLPLVRSAAEQRLLLGRPGYWDYASLLEIAVHREDLRAAQRYHQLARRTRREAWQSDSTTENLRLIASARRRRGQEAAWIEALASSLPLQRAEPTSR